MFAHCYYCSDAIRLRRWRCSGVSWQAGIFTGFLVALSSTAIVLKLIADRGETQAPHGQIGEECLRAGDRSVHLRICMNCGHTGCCDSSPNRHATKHFRATSHPIVRSLERGEHWGWCYADAAEL